MSLQVTIKISFQVRIMDETFTNIGEANEKVGIMLKDTIKKWKEHKWGGDIKFNGDDEEDCERYSESKTTDGRLVKNVSLDNAVFVLDSGAETSIGLKIKMSVVTGNSR